MQIHKLNVDPLIEVVSECKDGLQQGCSLDPTRKAGTPQALLDQMVDTGHRAHAGVKEVSKLRHDIREIREGDYCAKQSRSGYFMLALSVTLIALSVLTLGAAPGGAAAAASMSELSSLIAQSVAIATWCAGEGVRRLKYGGAQLALAIKGAAFKKERRNLRICMDRLHYWKKLAAYHQQCIKESMPVDPSKETLLYERELRALEKALQFVVGQLKYEVDDAEDFERQLRQERENAKEAQAL